MAEITCNANQSAVFDVIDDTYNKHDGTSLEMVFNGWDNALRRAVMSFDTSQLDGKRVYKVAELIIYVTSANYSASKFSFYIDRNMSAFDETTVNINSYLATNYNINSITPDASLGEKTLNISFKDSLGNKLISDVLYYGITLCVTSYTSDVHYGTLTINSSRATANKPRLKLTAYAVNPYQSNLSPSNGAYVNKSKAITFSWTFPDLVENDDYYFYGSLSLILGKFRWRLKNAETYNEIDLDLLSGTYTAFTLPADTLPGQSDIQWQVYLKTTDNEEATSAWQLITTTDQLSSASPMSPMNDYVDGSKAISFSWRHISNTGTAPTGYDIQYSADEGGSWTTVKTETGTDATTADLPADSLPAGNILWRVRTYNSDVVAGNWSSGAEICVQASPPLPTISSVTNTARPVINWQSLGQTGYQVKMNFGTTEIFDSGETAGTEKTLRIPMYVDDGGYTIFVRVKNALQLWSEWASYALTVSTTKPETPIASTLVSGGSAVITVRNYNAYTVVYVLRDGIPIKKMESGSWTDLTTAGTHKYIIRGTTSDAFADSAEMTANVVLTHASICAVDNLTQQLQLIYNRDAPPARSGSVGPKGGAQYYSGRKLPVYEYGEFFNTSRNYAYSFQQKGDFDQLRRLAICGYTLLYRSNEECVFGIITDLSYSFQRGSIDCAFSFLPVDCDEEIPYD